MTPRDRKANQKNSSTVDASELRRRFLQIHKQIEMQDPRAPPLNWTSPVLISATQHNRANYRRLFIKRCTEILNHAGRCQTVNCAVFNCTEMKRVWQHVLSCQARQLARHCKICSNFMILFYYHAKHCQKSPCDMMYCDTIKQQSSSVCTNGLCTSRRPVCE